MSQVATRYSLLASRFSLLALSAGAFEAAALAQDPCQAPATCEQPDDVIVTPGVGVVAMPNAVFTPLALPDPISAPYPCQSDLTAETWGSIAGIDVSYPASPATHLIQNQEFLVDYAFSDFTVNIGSGLIAHGGAPVFGHERFRWNELDNICGWSGWSAIVVIPPGGTPIWVGWGGAGSATMGRWRHRMDGTSEYDDRYVREDPSGVVSDGCHDRAVLLGVDGLLVDCPEITNVTTWVPIVNAINTTQVTLPDYTGYTEQCVSEFRRLGVVDAANTCSAEATQRMQISAIVHGNLEWSTYDEYTITAEVTSTQVRVMKTGSSWYSNTWP